MPLLQGGLIDHTNGLVRSYVGKGECLRDIDPGGLCRAADPINHRPRKELKTREHFPSDGAASKQLFVAIRYVESNWQAPVAQWRKAPNQLVHPVRRQAARSNLNLMAILLFTHSS